MNDLRGRWVLVTGAASGIGRATALAFAREGAALVIVDLAAGALEPVRASIAALGVPCVADAADVSDAAAVAALAARIHARIPAVDVLVNNAGIGYLGPVLETPDAAWRRIFDVNVLGCVHGCREFVPQMRAARVPRRIVNVASLAAWTPMPNLSAYSASKAAVVAFSEALTLELALAGAAIGVTTVCPGIVNTAITRPNGGNVSPVITAAQTERLQAYYAANGVEPEVVADAIVSAVRRGRDLVLVGKFARPLYHLRRLSRNLARRLLLRDARKVGYT
jgi:NAD(P)-dependent dehydrogenase (short-subunit alcohol dehydrogenase family)